jgi:hypothetical protein
MDRNGNAIGRGALRYLEVTPTPDREEIVRLVQKEGTEREEMMYTVRGEHGGGYIITSIVLVFTQNMFVGRLKLNQELNSSETSGDKNIELKFMNYCFLTNIIVCEKCI